MTCMALCILQRLDGFLYLSRVRHVVAAGQVDWFAEHDFDATRPSEVPGPVENLVESADPDRNDGYLQLGSDHADAGLECRNLAGIGHLALGKNQDAPALAGQLAHIAKRFQSAALALRNREGVEE